MVSVVIIDQLLRFLRGYILERYSFLITPWIALSTWAVSIRRSFWGGSAAIPSYIVNDPRLSTPPDCDMTFISTIVGQARAGRTGRSVSSSCSCLMISDSLDRMASPNHRIAFIVPTQHAFFTWSGCVAVYLNAVSTNLMRSKFVLVPFMLWDILFRLLDT